MRILSWHGYLLRGSGSNIYNANTARSWRRAGHEVLVLCQESDVSGLDFVDGAGDFDRDNSSYDVVPTDAKPSPGSCTVLRPQIGEVLPVYVFDEYEGFTAKLFVDLTEDELEHYVQSNVLALVTAIERFRPDGILVGHEVMGPYIAKLACARTQTSFIAKLHGSALEYAVKVQERYRHYAAEGLSAAAIVVGGSRYMLEEASRVIPGWQDKGTVVNPGCDIDLFQPRERVNARPLAGFVGKLIAFKGVHDLLAALGLTTTPGLSVTIVGYGGFEAGLRRLAESLAAGDVETAIEVACTGEDGPLTALLRILRSPPESYFRRAAEVPITFAGRLDHGPLSQMLPTFDVLVVPSVRAEAFGMVAAEAAACGVLPIVPAHSGIGEVGAALEDATGRPGLLAFDPSDPIAGIAARLDGVFSLAASDRAALEEDVVALARSRWSWTSVAEELLELATRAQSPPGPLD